MTRVARSLWERAKDALRVARHDLELSSDAAASRAYYAAFYAVSCLFALEGKTFKKHSGVEAAVHRDLVKQGTWAAELGQGYSRLVQLRSTGDYGEDRRVSRDEGEEAIQIASQILQRVAEMHPDVMTP